MIPRGISEGQDGQIDTLQKITEKMDDAEMNVLNVGLAYIWVYSKKWNHGVHPNIGQTCLKSVWVTSLVLISHYFWVKLIVPEMESDWSCVHLTFKESRHMSHC